MKSSSRPLISVTVPLFNESAGIQAFHADLLATVAAATKESYEIIYCDDGSTDTTSDIVRGLSEINPRVKLLQLSRNFGKESALSAAIHAASGQAVIMLDGDGQHPVALLPQFIAAWQQGAKVVIGLRSDNDSETFTKRFGSWLFYSLFNRLTGQKLTPGATDYRLIDRAVQQAFLKLPETDRITRGLIDWLGFKRTYVPITRIARTAGAPTYSLRKLMVLAANSFVSLSAVPLYIFGYLGILITGVAFLMGSSVFIEQILLRDPLSWRFTGSAMLGILILFLIGIVLISQGIISLYISHMHSQTKRRPLYIVDYEASSGLTDTENV
jgi:glycosyltransferase involved in cell wall biosynthesis